MMDILTKIHKQEERDYIIKESTLKNAILKEAENALGIIVNKNCEKVEILLNMKSNDIKYKIDLELYNKIEKKIYKIKYLKSEKSGKGSNNESNNQ